MDYLFDQACQPARDYFKGTYSDKNSKNYKIHFDNYADNKNEEKENFIDNKKKFNCDSNHLEKAVSKLRDPKSNKAQISSESSKIDQSTDLTTPPSNGINFDEINIIVKSSQDNIGPEKEILNKKRGNKPKEKGRVKNTMINVYKSHLFSKVQDEASDLLQQTEYYKKHGKNFNKISNVIYKVQGAKDNLSLIEKQLKDILADGDENNKEIIDNIFGNNDNDNDKAEQILKAFLNEYIKDLMYYFSCNDLNDEKFKYKSKLKNSYKTFIDKLKIKKKEVYINRLEKWIKDIKNTFVEMKRKGDNIKQKRLEKEKERNK